MVPRSTYAADAEDVVAEALLGRVERFVDVGANDGFSGSNVFRFVLRGATGLCFEPDPENFARLRALLRWNRRVECLPVALSSADGTLELRCEGVLSQLAGSEDPALDALLVGLRPGARGVVRVRLERLGEYLRRRPELVPLDLLSIDVEGHELAVLQGIDWTATPTPARLIVLETHAESATGAWRHRDYEAIEALLAAAGYRSVAASANNTFWLHGSAFDGDRLAAARALAGHYRWRDA